MKHHHGSGEAPEPSPGCGGCHAAVPVATEAEGWRIWVLQEAIVQKPHGRDDIAPITEPAGTIFVLCAWCTDLLASREYPTLAKQLASLRQCTSECPANGQAVAEMVTWLMRLHSWALPMTEREWLATR